MAEKKPRSAKSTGKSRVPKARSGQPAPVSRPIETGPMAETFSLTNVEQLKCISVPIRLKILEAMAVKPMTTKQVALQLGESVTGLYRHVEALAELGLVVLVDEVPKRGTVQKFYRSAARRFVADNACLPQVGSNDPRLDTLLELIDSARRGILAHSQIQSNSPLAASGASTLVKVAAEEYESLIAAITDAIENWQNARKSGKKSSHQRHCRVSLFVYPESAES